MPVRTWTRHAEPTHPQSSPVRDLWLFGGIWNDLCRRAGLDRDAQTSIKRRHEPKDGDNHGRFKDPVGAEIGEERQFIVQLREGMTRVRKDELGVRGPTVAGIQWNDGRMVNAQLTLS